MLVEGSGLQPNITYPSLEKNLWKAVSGRQVMDLYAQFSLTAHCSLLTAYCSLLTAHCILLTAYCSLLTSSSPHPLYRDWTAANKSEGQQPLLAGIKPGGRSGDAAGLKDWKCIP